MQSRISAFLAVFFFPLLGLAQTVTNALYNDLDLNAKTIDQSKPVGAIEGAGSVTLTGAATYTIPIKCPPGTNGMVPNISLTYSSQSGSGIMGMGWNISGLSVIGRVSRDVVHDGEVGPVTLTNDDRLALDGNRMILATGTYGQAGSAYRLESDNFSTVTMYDNGANRWFRVITKDGTEMDYGSTSDSRFLNDNGSQVLLWRLNRIKDINGNYIDFVYTNGGNSRQMLIEKIQYTGNLNTGTPAYNEIVFSYLTKPQPTTAFEAGASYQNNSLVKSLSLKVEGNITKVYNLNYGHNNINTFLKEVKEVEPSGDELNSTVFKYGDEPSNVTSYNVFGAVGSGIEHISGDYNGDGLTDVVALVRLSDFHSSFTVYKAKGNSQFDWVKNVSLPSGTNVVDDETRKKLNHFLFQSFDFQGDGYEDLLAVQINNNGTSNSNTLSEVNIRYGDPSAILPNSSIPFPAVLGYTLVPKNKQFLFPGDFDGDGKTDFVIFQGYSTTQQIGSQTLELEWYAPFLYRHDQTPCQLVTNFSINWSSNSDRIQVIDFDGDGKNELIVFEDSQFIIYTVAKKPSGGFTLQQLKTGGYPTKWHKVFPATSMATKKRTS